MAWKVASAAVACFGAAAALLSAAIAEPAQRTPAASEKTNSSARKGVRIELTVPRPAGKPAETAAPKSPASTAKNWPKTIPEAEAEKAAASRPPAIWSPQDVAAAKARCTAILKRIHAVAIAEAPIKEGVCGTPAPIQLISIGQNPQVSLSPPATITCDFAEALENWVETDLQPLARKHLGSGIIKIEVMSSYSCRNAYGRAGNRLSEHGLANALDIRGFVTSAGAPALVLEHWGTPQREIAARVAAEKMKAARALAAAQAAEKAAQAAHIANKSRAAAAGTPPATTGSTVGAPAGGIARSTIVDGTPRVTVTIPGAESPAPSDGEDASGTFSMAPSRLGGPKVGVTIEVRSPAAAAKDKAEKAAKSRAAEGERRESFLHAVHASACRTFGTTLGPEANAAHRNHLHIDMASRSNNLKICD